MKKFLYHLDDVIASICLIITILIVVVNVTCRYLLNITFQWAEELATICFVWVVFVGAASAYKHNLHVGIDVLVNLFHGKVRKGLTLFVDLVLILSNVLLTVLSAQFAIYGSVKPTGVLRIPYTYVNISATVGFGLMLIYSLVFFWRDLRKFNQPDEEPADPASASQS
ncbi:MAG: TRAP transporter small permease [Eubacteriales bacterium]